MCCIMYHIGCPYCGKLSSIFLRCVSHVRTECICCCLGKSLLPHDLAPSIARHGFILCDGRKNLSDGTFNDIRPQRVWMCCCKICLVAKFYTACMRCKSDTWVVRCGIRTHAHSRVPELKSWRLRPLGQPDCTCIPSFYNKFPTTHKHLKRLTIFSRVHGLSFLTLLCKNIHAF